MFFECNSRLLKPPILQVAPTFNEFLRLKSVGTKIFKDRVAACRPKGPAPFVSTLFSVANYVFLSKCQESFRLDKNVKICPHWKQISRKCFQRVGNTEPFQKECRSALLAPLRAGPLQICYFVMMQVSGMWFCYKKPIDERLARLRRNCSVHMTKNLPVSQICGKRTFFNREPLIVCC